MKFKLNDYVSLIGNRSKILYFGQITDLEGGSLGITFSSASHQIASKNPYGAKHKYLRFSEMDVREWKIRKISEEEYIVHEILGQ